MSLSSVGWPRFGNSCNRSIAAKIARNARLAASGLLIVNAKELANPLEVRGGIR
jgi:hypothetical protein